MINPGTAIVYIFRELKSN